MKTRQLIATVWKPPKSMGGGAENLKLESIGVEYANTICARYYKGPSAQGANVILVIEEEENASSHSGEQNQTTEN